MSEEKSKTGRPKRERESCVVRVTVSKDMKEKITKRACVEDLDTSDALRPFLNAYGRGDLSMKPVWSIDKK